MKILFKYRAEGGRVITTNNGDEKIMVIRTGPRGIVARVYESRLIVIWSKEDADSHIDDSEDDLIQKIIEVLNV